MVLLNEVKQVFRKEKYNLFNIPRLNLKRAIEPSPTESLFLRYEKYGIGHHNTIGIFIRYFYKSFLSFG